jgi:large subunit ribosomal protein L24
MSEKKKLHVKAGDTVEVILGKDKGKKGKVLKALPKEDRVVVEGVNMISKHTKPRGAGQQGGIIKQEGKIHASNVMLVCRKCGKRTRLAHKVLNDGSRVRVCKKCGETFND